ncbi:hypothetical protein GC170_03965 [bacterium]|nr:hypothetical protein [bacterium]
MARRREDLERVLPIDELQIALTEKWIVPVLAEIETEFLEIRMAVDVELSRRFAQGPSKPGFSKATKIYPEGYCLQITKHVLDEFEKRHAERPSKVSTTIDSFRRDGGHFHRVWGILRDKYFQNALQIGSLYFDIANDTVDVAKPKLEYMPMADSGFRNITSFEDYATIVESYCGGTIYPNNHFPSLAPLMPILWIDERMELTIRSSIQYMLHMNIDTGFLAAERFLTQSPWADRPLPDAMAERIERFKAESLPAKSRTPATGVSLETLRANFEEYRNDRSHSSRVFLARMLDWSFRVRLKIDS